MHYSSAVNIKPLCTCPSHIAFAALLLLRLLTHGVNRPFYSFLSFIGARRGDDRRVLSVEYVCEEEHEAGECK